MKKHINRGFTIVELVIVIAVIAILAAVLIPTFANIIKKAETAGDIQMVRNLNMIVAAETATGNGELSPHGAIVAAEDGGYKVEKLTPTSEGRTIVWDAANYRFALLEDGNEIYPKDEKSGTPIANMFVISDTYPAEGYDGYAVYLTEGYEGHTLNVTTGVDTGVNELITEIIYTGDAEVAIRGNEHTAIQVNSGKVHHYDVALTAYINGGEYVEHGTLVLAQSEGALPDAAGFAGGAGTEENPWLIASAEQAQQMAQYSTEMYRGTKRYFKLIDDLDLTGKRIEGTQCALATYFNGVFDGDGHSLKLDPATFAVQYVYDGSSAVFKNLTLIQPAEGQTILAFVLYDDTTFENITVKAEDPDVVLSFTNGCSSFCQLVEAGSDYVFRNCVSEVNYTTSYGGIFVGNYVDCRYEAGMATFTFENCVNKGTVTGADIGFFVGNPSQGLPVVKGADYSGFTIDPSIRTYEATISNCRNEGLILATNSAEPFLKIASAAGQTVSEPRAALLEKSNGLIDSSMLVKGAMLVSNIDIGLKRNGSEVSIVPTADPIITEYEYRVYVSTTNNEMVDGKRVFKGNHTFAVTQRISAADAATAKLKYVTNVMYSTKYDETNDVKFADLEKKTEYWGLYEVNYAEVLNADGSYTWVISWDDVWKVYGNTDAQIGTWELWVNSTPRYSIEALDADGNTRGLTQYEFVELPVA